VKSYDTAARIGGLGNSMSHLILALSQTLQASEAGPSQGGIKAGPRLVICARLGTTHFPAIWGLLVTPYGSLRGSFPEWAGSVVVGGRRTAANFATQGPVHPGPRGL